MANHVDNKKIEKAAAQAVEALVQPCETIDQKITVDDKNVFVDGTFDLYRSSELVKENLVDQIHVQVKGTISGLKINKRGFTKYKVSVADLKSYYDVYHGVLYFCVTVDKSTLTGTKVYYAQLLPYDINKVLKGLKPDQKTIMLRFREFPTEPREINRLLIAFHNDKEEQLKAKVSGYGFLDENKQLPSDIVSYSFTSQLYPGESPVSLAGLRNGAYIYGTTKKGEVVVFGKLEDVAMLGISSERLVSSGDFEMKTNVLAGEPENGHYFEFEGVRMTLSDGRATVNYAISGGFRKRYRTIRIMEEFLRTGELFIDGNRLLSTGPNGEKVKKEDEEAIGELQEQEKLYRGFIETLDTLGVGSEVIWDPTKLTDKEFRNLTTMHQVFVEKKPLRNDKITPPMVRFDIQDATIFALVRKREDGSFDFIDLMSDEGFFVFGTPDERAQNPDLGFDPVPAVVVVGKEGFGRMANLDPVRFRGQMHRYHVTTANQEPLNQKLLEMLAAYDEGAVQPRELLGCAVILAHSLNDFDSASSIYFINLLQTIRRMRKLTESEKDELSDLAIDAPEMKTKAAAYALLGNHDMAQRCFNRCSLLEQKELEQFPIGRFFNKEEDHTTDNPVMPQE